MVDGQLLHPSDVLGNPVCSTGRYCITLFQFVLKPAGDSCNLCECCYRLALPKGWSKTHDRKPMKRFSPNWPMTSGSVVTSSILFPACLTQQCLKTPPVALLKLCEPCASEDTTVTQSVQKRHKVQQDFCGKHKLWSLVEWKTEAVSRERPVFILPRSRKCCGGLMKHL